MVMKFYYLKKIDCDEFTGSVELPIVVSKNLKQLLLIKDKCNLESDSETEYKVEELNIKSKNNNKSNIVCFLIEDITDFDWTHREIKSIDLESNIDDKNLLKKYYLNKSKKEGNDCSYYYEDLEIKNSLTRSDIDIIIKNVNL